MGKDISGRRFLEENIGKEINVTAFVAGEGTTKGRNPERTIILKNISIYGSNKKIDHLWMVTKKFSVGKTYSFAADIIEYVVYGSDSGDLRVGIGNPKHVIENNGTPSSSMIVKKRMENAKSAIKYSDSNAIALIQTAMEEYGILITPSFSKDKMWECSISNEKNGRVLLVSSEQKFVDSVIKASDIIEFFKEEF